VRQPVFENVVNGHSELKMYLIILHHL